MLPLSFEFFPPKTHELEHSLWQAFDTLKALGPSFVSVTYGAGGSTRERTHAIVKRMAAEGHVRPAAHLTCVGASREEINAVIDSYQTAGVHHVVALRGDPPAGQTHYTPHPEGYAYAQDLVEALAARGEFEISVAAYPEKHPESASIAQDIEFLKRKQDSGATRAITQYFFDVDAYARFLELAHKAGITLPIVPGILPMHHVEQVVKFSARCGAHVPAWLLKRFEGLDANPEKRTQEALQFGEELCRGLINSGAPGLHFYTLNRAELSAGIVQRLQTS